MGPRAKNGVRTHMTKFASVALSPALLSHIDKSVSDIKKQRPGFSRNTWICEAVRLKLEKDSLAEKSDQQEGQLVFSFDG